MTRALGLILPGWRWLYALQPISDWPVGLEFPRRAGRCRPEGLPVFIPRGYRSCSDREILLNRRWTPMLPRLRLRYAPQPISDRPAGLGFPYYGGGVDPVKLDFSSHFSSPGCRSHRDMECCLNRVWDPILPRCGGTGGVLSLCMAVVV